MKLCGCSGGWCGQCGGRGMVRGEAPPFLLVMALSLLAAMVATGIAEGIERDLSGQQNASVEEWQP